MSSLVLECLLMFVCASFSPIYSLQKNISISSSKSYIFFFLLIITRLAIVSFYQFLFSINVHRIGLTSKIFSFLIQIFFACPSSTINRPGGELLHTIRHTVPVVVFFPPRPPLPNFVGVASCSYACNPIRPPHSTPAV